jgi:hypothetical protein
MATLVKKSRQRRVLEVLEKQLVLGTKTLKGTLSDKVELTDHDRKRISKEIELLKSKIA